VKYRATPRVAVIGCGMWGINHVRVWHELGHLRAVCDESPAQLDQLKSRFPEVQTCDDPDDIIGDPAIDAVVIATPPITHADIGLRALEGGKDVLIEKPLATSVAEAEKVVEVAQRNGSILMVGHVLEYHPGVVALGRLVAEGALGKVQYVYSHRLNFGRLRTEENALWSFAPHDIALLLRLMGVAPAEVACRGSSFLNEGVADVTLMSLDFGRSVQAHVFVSWLHPFKEHRFVVVGNHQMAVFDDTAQHKDKLLLYPHRVDWVNGRAPVARRAEAIRVPIEDYEPLRAECEAFLQSIKARKQPLTDGYSGLEVLRVLEAGERSLHAGGKPMAPRSGKTESPTGCHPTATIDPAAMIGSGTRIWHYSHVMPAARIGSHCTLGQNVFVGRNVRIGDGVKIQNNVSVYEGVELEDDVFCGPSAVFTNVNRPRSEVDCSDQFSRTLVRRGATLGANCTIVCGTTIGRHSFIAAGAVVTKDVPDHALVAGVPARIVGWVCKCGERLDFDSRDDCSSCGFNFWANGDPRILLGQT
jgi:UDP-2-acetamido-3-amino-2,3-dideoxy-glucuronate N-acetyltransferase